MNLSHYINLIRDGSTIQKTLAHRRRIHQTRASWSSSHLFPREVVNRFHPDRFDVLVTEIRTETPSTKTFVLTPIGRSAPPYRPGQFVNVYVTIDGVKTSRPQSISSPPFPGAPLEITIRRMERGFVSRHLVDNLRIGDTLSLSGPEGDLTYSPIRDGSDLVFIAGGSGITPQMPLLEQLALYPQLRLQLLYGSRSEKDIIFRSRIEKLTARHINVRHLFVISKPSPNWRGQTGHIDHQLLLERLSEGSLPQKTFFLCGPPGMENSVKEALLALGVPRQRIRRETAGPSGDITQSAGWPDHVRSDSQFKVKIINREKIITVHAGELLLNSLERSGIAPKAVCRSGNCSSCRATLLSGSVFTPEGYFQRNSHNAHQVIHTCVCFPTTDLVIKTH